MLVKSMAMALLCVCVSVSASRRQLFASEEVESSDSGDTWCDYSAQFADDSENESKTFKLVAILGKGVFGEVCLYLLSNLSDVSQAPLVTNQGSLMREYDPNFVFVRKYFGSFETITNMESCAVEKQSTPHFGDDTWSRVAIAKQVHYEYNDDLSVDYGIHEIATMQMYTNASRDSCFDTHAPFLDLAFINGMSALEFARDNLTSHNEVHAYRMCYEMVAQVNHSLQAYWSVNGRYLSDTEKSTVPKANAYKGDTVATKGAIMMDLKPENIMYDSINRRFVPIDFGKSVFVDNGITQVAYGAYMSSAWYRNSHQELYCNPGTVCSALDCDDKHALIITAIDFMVSSGADNDFWRGVLQPLSLRNNQCGLSQRHFKATQDYFRYALAWPHWRQFRSEDERTLKLLIRTHTRPHCQLW